MVANQDTKLEQPEVSDKAFTATLEEYKTLRQEILNQQQHWHQINTLGFTVGSAIVGILVLANSDFPLIKGLLLFAITIIFFALICSQVYRRKKIYFIGRYIEYVIESNMPGLFWETSWCRKRGRIPTDICFLENLPLLILQITSFIGGICFCFKDTLSSFSEIIICSFLQKSGILFFLLSIVVFMVMLCSELKKIREVYSKEYEKEFQDKQKKFDEDKRTNRSWFMNSSESDKR